MKQALLATRPWALALGAAGLFTFVASQEKEAQVHGPNFSYDYVKDHPVLSDAGHVLIAIAVVSTLLLAYAIYKKLRG